MKVHRESRTFDLSFSKIRMGIGTQANDSSSSAYFSSYSCMSALHDRLPSGSHELSSSG